MINKHSRFKISPHLVCPKFKKKTIVEVALLCVLVHHRIHLLFFLWVHHQSYRSFNSISTTVLEFIVMRDNISVLMRLYVFLIAFRQHRNEFRLLSTRTDSVFMFWSCPWVAWQSLNETVQVSGELQAARSSRFLRGCIVNCRQHTTNNLQGQEWVFISTCFQHWLASFPKMR